MTFTIERIARSAKNYVKSLPKVRQEAIAQAFDYLCQVSLFRHPNPTVIKPLKGQYKGLWRYRVGEIRIVYAIDEETRTIQIVEIDNRGNMY
jgi:mRNA interferase RelE/StbE